MTLPASSHSGGTLIATLRRRLRLLLCIASATAIVASVVISVLGNPGGVLSEADAAEDFEPIVLQQATPRDDKKASATSGGSTQAASTADAGKSGVLRQPLQLSALRWSMALDSFALVPAYSLLMMVCAVTFVAARGGEDTLQPAVEHGLHGRILLAANLACALPVLGAMFDITENALTIRAAEDALRFVLADATVADLHLATELKWGFLAVASLQLGLQATIALHRRGGAWQRVAARLSLAAAIVFMAVFVRALGAASPQHTLPPEARACAPLLGATLLLLVCALWPVDTRRAAPAA